MVNSPSSPTPIFPPTPPPTQQRNNKYKYTIMKITFLLFGVLSLLTLGWSTRVSLPRGSIKHHQTLKAMETFYPELSRSHPPSQPYGFSAQPSNALDVFLGEMKRKKADDAAEKMREEWAKLTAKFLGRSNKDVTEAEEDEDDQVVQDEKEEEANKMEAVGGVEKRFYSQIEVADMEASKRGLLNWVMQMDYSGQTFFDGYVFLFPLLLAPSRRFAYSRLRQVGSCRMHVRRAET
jgi:hypothetical protein